VHITPFLDVAAGLAHDEGLISCIVMIAKSMVAAEVGHLSFVEFVNGNRGA
jgi:hypothetical protein